MGDFDSPGPQGPGGGVGARPAKADLTARLLLRESLTARRAAAIIASFTLLITVAGAILARLVDHQEYPSIGKGCGSRCRRSRRLGMGTSPRRTPTGGSSLRS